MTARPHVLIVFPDEWPAYSPTLLNLVRALADDFTVRVIAFDGEGYRNDSLDRSVFDLIRIAAPWSRGLRRVRMFEVAKVALLFRALRRVRADHVIAVDSLSAFVVQRLCARYHYLSLEAKRDRWFRSLDRRRIDTVLIQSEERFRHLFPDGGPEHMLLFNSPYLDPYSPRPRDPRGLVYLGNVVPKHGIYDCLDALRLLPEWRLTIRGIVTESVAAEVDRRYGDLARDGRLVVDGTYIEQAAIAEYLSAFSVGFCFYDFELIGAGDFNYISCPSGKLFNYYAAGLAVIGSDILGLRSVRDHDAGILLSTVTPQAIARAVTTIAADPDRYRKHSLAAAREFDFAASVTPFRDRLLARSRR